MNNENLMCCSLNEKKSERERERTRKPNSPWNIYCLTMEMKEELRELDRVVKKKFQRRSVRKVLFGPIGPALAAWVSGQQ